MRNKRWRCLVICYQCLGGMNRRCLTSASRRQWLQPYTPSSDAVTPRPIQPPQSSHAVFQRRHMLTAEAEHHHKQRHASDHATHPAARVLGQQVVRRQKSCERIPASKKIFSQRKAGSSVRVRNTVDLGCRRKENHGKNRVNPAVRIEAALFK